MPELSRRVRIRLATAVTATVILIAAAAPAGAGEFGDVPDDAYYAGSVAWMVANDITQGTETGCFGPDDRVTRGQVAAFLFRLDRSLGNDPRTAPHPFTDVIHGYQHGPIGWLYGADITRGTSSSSFAPGEPITRGDFAALLWRYAGEPDAGRHGFADVTASYQHRAIAWMSETGITRGTSAARFAPERHMSRAEAAAFLHRFAGAPAVADTGTPLGCARGHRAALVAGGLTPAEAACAAPWLTDFSIAYLDDVVNGRADATFELLIAVATINDENCVATARIAELSQRYF